MTRDKRPPQIEDSNYLECLRIYGKKEAAKLFKKKKKGEFDEKELASGSAELIENQILMLTTGSKPVHRRTLVQFANFSQRRQRRK